MSKLQGNTPEQSEKNDSLNRSLSHGQLTMIAMGLALGTGLFLGSSSAIKIAGPRRNPLLRYWFDDRGNHCCVRG